MFTTRSNKKRGSGPSQLFLIALAILLCSTVGPTKAASPSGIPAYLIVKPEAPSRGGQRQGLQMNSTKRASYKTNPLWLKHHNRLKERKTVAAKLKRRTAQSKNYSRVSLNYRLNVDITNPMGINPWGNHYRQSWYSHHRASWLYVPRVTVPVVTSSGY